MVWTASRWGNMLVMELGRTKQSERWSSIVPCLMVWTTSRWGNVQVTVWRWSTVRKSPVVCHAWWCALPAGGESCRKRSRGGAGSERIQCYATLCQIIFARVSPVNRALRGCRQKYLEKGKGAKEWSVYFWLWSKRAKSNYVVWSILVKILNFWQEFSLGFCQDS